MLMSVNTYSKLFLIIPVSFRMGHIAFSFFWLLLLLLVLSENSLAGNQQNWDQQRESAKAQINSRVTNDVKNGMKILKQLSTAGDHVSSHTLGIIFLRSKLSQVKKNPKLAEKYFLFAAEGCHSPSINALDKFFYSRRGSDFFAPNKIKVIKTKCARKNTTNIIADQDKPETSPDGPSQSKNIEVAKLDDKITSSVKAKWGKIPPSLETAPIGASGFAANANGLFITNEHVVNKCTDYAVLYNGMLGKARLLRKNAALDIALLSVNAPTPHHAVFDSSDFKLGEGLIAIGYPDNSIFGDEPSVSEGKLTNVSDEETQVRKKGFLLVSVPMASGNSGGPILSEHGLLRGVVSYGFNSQELMEEKKNSEGSAPAIGTVNVNFMVSGLRIINWLDRNNISAVKRGAAGAKLDTVEASQIGMKMLARVFCG